MIECGGYDFVTPADFHFLSILRCLILNHRISTKYLSHHLGPRASHLGPPPCWQCRCKSTNLPTASSVIKRTACDIWLPYPTFRVTCIIIPQARMVPFIFASTLSSCRQSVGGIDRLGTHHLNSVLQYVFCLSRLWTCTILMA